jgi:hypothetical protein
MSLSWGDIELLTKGRLGEIDTPCPACSHTRRKKKDKCFRVWMSHDFAGFNCEHCKIKGSVRPDKQAIVSPAELRRMREEKTRQEAKARAERIAEALEIWGEAGPFDSSPAKIFLSETRKLRRVLDRFDLDQVLRFHPACQFRDKRLPCMIALVRDMRTDVPVAIHRTALSSGRRPERIGRRALGPTSGGAIKLSPHSEVSDTLLIGEGIETSLAASQRLGLRPVWSLLSRSGYTQFPILPKLKHLTVATDLDESGDGQRDATALVRRMADAGIEAYARVPTHGKDFNDELMHQKGAA